jgi:hypothetical protein
LLLPHCNHCHCCPCSCCPTKHFKTNLVSDFLVYIYILLFFGKNNRLATCLLPWQFFFVNARAFRWNFQHWSEAFEVRLYLSLNRFARIMYQLMRAVERHATDRRIEAAGKGSSNNDGLGLTLQLQKCPDEIACT